MAGIVRGRLSEPDSELRRWALSPEMRNLFEIHKAGEFRRMVELWWPLFLFIHVALSVLGYFALWRHPAGLDERIYGAVTLAGLFVSCTSIWVVRKPRGLMSRDKWLPWAAFVIAFAMASGGVHYNRDAYIHFAFMSCTLVALIYMCALRPSLRAASKFTALNVVGMPLLWLAGSDPVAASYAIHMSLICFTGLFCVFLRNEQDRDAFLKSARLHEVESQLKSINRELDYMARKDPLTGLSNRRTLDETILRECQRAARNRRPMAVLMIDIDFFKRFNDQNGHLAGDACLVAVSNALFLALQRPGDSIARFGGEEFAVLLPDTDAKGAEQVARRLLKHVDDLGVPHPASDVAKHVTISIGIVVMDAPQKSMAKKMLEFADAMLYQAKENGRHGLALHRLGSAACDFNQAASKFG
jgi:diguanylate cyclase (GGDEF)-like protein